MKKWNKWIIVLVAITFCQCNKNENPEPIVSGGTFVITADVNVQYQVMEGFGASDAWRCQMIGQNWPLDKRAKIADLLFSQEKDANGNPKGIGLSMWRFNIGAGSAEQEDESFIPDPWKRTECFLKSDGTYDWTKQPGQQWFLRSAKAHGVEKIVGFTNSPPVYFTMNQKAFSPGGWHANLKDTKFDSYASFLADVAEHFKNEGQPIDYLSPFNEPQWNWTAGTDGYASQEGTPASNDEIASLVKSLSEKLASKQLSTKVAIGEAGTIEYLYKTNDADRGNQIESFFKLTSSNYIGNLPNVEKVISSHSYFTVWPVSDMISMRESLYSKINTTDPSLHYWQSEYCILETANTDLSDGWGRDLTMQIALYVARLIHYDITKARASSWSWWTALSTGDYKDGLIYLDDGTNQGLRTDQPEYCRYDGYIRESKLLWALGNYSFFIRPGMKRIWVGSPDITPNQPYGLLISAYIDSNKNDLYVVIINYNKNDRIISLNLKNATMATDSVSCYVTSENYNLAKMKKSSSSKISLSANSITTLVAKYK